MIEKVISLLKNHGINEYIISKANTLTRELFFVKTSLDLSRAKNVTYYNVTVFVASEDGTQKGQSNMVFGPNASTDEIESKLESCIVGAKNAMNPTFELPDSEVAFVENAGEDLTSVAEKMAKAIFAPTSKNSFVNSAEVFAERTIIHTVTSKGGDVSYTTDKVTGEFVVQAKEPKDVELHISFEYDKPDTAALSELVADSLKTVYDRARAVKELKSGTYNLVLDGKFIGTLMDLYLERANAAYVYMGYSDYKVGESVQPDAKGEKLSVVLKSTAPYSGDGIKMTDRTLLENGELKSIFGSTRYCRYLGIEPTGGYNTIELENGTKSMDELLTDNTLYIVAFSDFQCDAFTGVFGGEIRLGYLYENGNVKPITGGSCSGNLLKLQNNMTFTKERFNSLSYKGPKACKIEGVTVAGVE